MPVGFAKYWLPVVMVAAALVAIVVAQQPKAAPRTQSVRSSRGLSAVMPGKSYRGPQPKLDASQLALRDALKKDVQLLAGTIGERNVYRYDKLVAARDAIEKSLTAAGHLVRRQTFKARGQDCHNLEVIIPGQSRAKEVFIVGAHYDSVRGSAAANDNGSGVAALLAMARSLSGKKTERTVRLLAFANEEQPFFQTELMGSLVYARWCKQNRDQVVGMISLETIGYYSDRPGSQRYPGALGAHYPSTGNFIALVGNTSSAPLVTKAVEIFRRDTKFPCEGAALPGELPGVGWSDHWSFWQQGYPAMMVTDTALFRYPHYHTGADTPEKLSYDRMALAVEGIQRVVAELVGATEK